MKTHKTIMAVLAGSLLALSSNLLAADTNTPPAGGGPPAAGGPPGARGGRMGPNLEEMFKDLNLTDEQKPKVTAAFQTRRQKMMELFQDKSASQEDRMSKRQAIMDDFHKELKDAGLTQDQIDKIDKASPGGRRMRQPGGPGGPGGGGEKASEKPAAPPQE